VLPLLIQISAATHSELYHDWRKSLDFCRTLPDLAPPAPVTFHMFWRERSGGVWPRAAKSIALSEQARLALGIETEHVTPTELIRALRRN